jgi:hypothetical protein
MCLLLSYAHAQTSDYDKGLAAFNAKDFKTTIAQLTPYALKGMTSELLAIRLSVPSSFVIINEMSGPLQLFGFHVCSYQQCGSS